MMAILIVIGIATMLLLAFVVLCAGVRADDNGPGLHGQAPGPAAWLARRFTGLKTEPMPARRPGGPVRRTRAAAVRRTPAAGPKAGAGKQVARNA